MQLEETLAQVETRSETDALTGLANRRALSRKLSEEFDRSKRYGVPLSMLMIDVDRFKAFNDSFGHPVGDDLLKSISQLLAEKARGSDFVARYGGEEFTILLPSTGREGAFILAERFRRAVESMPSSRRATTISVGVSTFSPEISDADSLLEAADRALYLAKQSGRNRVAQAPHRP